MLDVCIRHNPMDLSFSRVEFLSRIERRKFIVSQIWKRCTKIFWKNGRENFAACEYGVRYSALRLAISGY